ncbi:MAG: hypothetical protein NTZ84_02880, partial [Candidatus Nealsonbacteria bacterium]|nr:hypothetical protein [Candidatus Nealsonbacteria bacterium]
MSWLVVTILAYFILALAFLVDKYLLVSSIQNPKVYVFYTGALGGLTLFLIPFVGFSIPLPSQIALSLLAGAFFIIGIYWFYKTLQKYEASRIVPAIGGMTPIFSFLAVFISSGGKETLSSFDFLALIFLVIGTILITFEKGKGITLDSFSGSFVSAFFLSISFVLIKYVYLVMEFWPGFIWTKIGSFITAICFFVFFSEVRKEIFGKKKESMPRKTSVIFLSNQAMGGLANVMQNWALFLAPLAFVSVINALQGVQYVFLLCLIVFLSFFFPALAEKGGL